MKIKTSGMKTFHVHGQNGQKVEARQLATLTHYIDSVQFRFVVTELPGTLPAVTHRLSGKRVCGIELSTLAAARSDYSAAGKAALTRFVEARDASRIAQVLRAAEQAANALPRGIQARRRGGHP